MLNKFFDWLILPKSTRELSKLNRKWEEFNICIKNKEDLTHFKTWIKENPPEHHKDKYKLFERFIDLSIPYDNP